jgi:hypothetical protein
MNNKIITESFTEEERVFALATYLGVDASDCTNTYDNEFETPEGDYYVVTEEEAEELAREDIINLFDELGLEAFTEYFRSWILENALDKDWFEDAVRESTEAYVDDIAYEDGRLEEELLEAGIITEADVEEGYDVEDAKERYVQYLMDETGDFVDYCGFNFGWDWVSKVAVQNNLIDMDAVVEQCLFEDGVAHFIARYDGEEHDLGNGLFAYRNN